MSNTNVTPTPIVHPKNPGLALVASFFITGLGQLMNGEGGKGVAMFFLQVVNVMLMFVLIGFITWPIVWIWSMADAYMSAKAWNMRHGVIS